MATTNLRKELISYYNALLELYPNVIQYHNDLEFFESGEKREKPYPLHWFVCDILRNMEFYLTDDSIMNSVRRGLDRPVKTYEYESALYVHDTIEIKSIRLTKSIRKRLGDKINNFIIRKTPSGKEFVCLYRLWVDVSSKEMDVEYSTVNEIFFCQYLVNREIISEELRGYRFRKIDMKSFKKGNTVIEPSGRYSLFSISILMSGDYVCIGEVDVDDLLGVLSVFDKNDLWSSSYKEIEKCKSLKGLIEF